MIKQRATLGLENIEEINFSGNNLSAIPDDINKLPKLNYTLIDFGSGDGDFINNIYNIKSIKKTIGTLIKEGRITKK